MKRERTPISRNGSAPRTVTPPVVFSRQLTGAESRLRGALPTALPPKVPVPTYTKSQVLEVKLAALRQRLAEAKATEAALTGMLAGGEAAIDESVLALQHLQDKADAAMEADAKESESILQSIYAATQRARMEADKAREDAGESEVLASAYRDERQDLEGQHAREVEAFDALLPSLEAAQTQTAEATDHLIARHAQAKLMQSSTYGLTSDAAACVLEDERITKNMQRIRHAAIETEVKRRQQFSLYEELKGTIRVYCRVKGPTDPTASLAKYTFPGASEGEPCDMAAALEDHINARATVAEASDDAAADRMSLSASARTSDLKHAIEKRTLTLTQTRLNATSTGTKDSVNTFQYDRVFGPKVTQEEVFADVGPLVDCAVDGYRVCIMAYGQTGSGKTYTMEGDIGDSQSVGIIPRAIEKVFDRAALLAVDGWETRVVCYFVEIYNGTIRDLLSTDDSYHRAYAENSKDAGKAHSIQHRGRVDTVITNVKEVLVTCPGDIHKLLSLAVGNRSVAKTLMNERSSRSHYVFTMRIEGVNQRLGERSLGSLCLVDLAGSERLNDSGAQGQRQKEAIKINESLSYLGDCIVALGKGDVVPWGVCELTKLLQNYLGGEGAKVLMIVNVSEKEEHTASSLNTLRFATKVNQTQIAKAVKRTLAL